MVARDIAKKQSPAAGPANHGGEKVSVPPGPVSVTQKAEPKPAGPRAARAAAENGRKTLFRWVRKCNQQWYIACPGSLLISAPHIKTPKRENIRER